MSFSRKLLASLGALLVAACAAPAGGPEGSAGSTGDAVDTAPVVIGWNSPPDENYVPILMAIEEMQKQGYKIEARQLPETSLVIQALTANQVQFAAEGVTTGALAIKEGAPIRIISTQNANQAVWATLPEHKDCASLAGQPVGVFAIESGYTTLQNLYLDANCPGTREQAKITVIPDSALRAQALVEGQIAATVLSLGDALILGKEYPGKFNIVYLSEALPGIGDEHFYTNETTLKDHPDIVRAFAREQLLAQRKLYENPEIALEQVQKHIEGAKSDDVIQEFIKQRIWYANGGLRGPGLKDTLEGFGMEGDPATIADLSILESVLEQIGVSDLTEY